MNKDEWCRSVLKKFFPANVNNQTRITPALASIAGRIWREWEQMRGFTGTVDVAVAHAPYGVPPGLGWIAQVLLSGAWRTFAGDQAVDPWFRARIQREYGMEFRLAIGGASMSE